MEDDDMGTRKVRMSLEDDVWTSHPLPPLEADNITWGEDDDFDEVTLKCVKCPDERMVTLQQLKEHKAWHERTNTLFYLRQLTQTIATVPFGPGGTQVGTLFKLDQGALSNLKRTSFIYALVQGINDRSCKVTRDREAQEVKSYLKDGKQIAGVRYIEGQKYTVGQEFTSREEQGEFLFFDDLNPSPQSNGLQDYFELETRNDGLWIRTVSKENSKGGQISIAVNGEKLYTLSPSTEVMFGDVITLEGNGGKYCDLIFIPYLNNLTAQRKRMREVKVTEDDVVPTIRSPLNNQLIVRTILSFFSTREIKTYRLISPIWSEEGMALMKKSVYVNIGDGNINPHQQRLFNFAHDIADHHEIPTWRITLPPQEYYNHRCKLTSLILKNPELVASKQRKLKSDIDWLFSSREFSHNITSLRLRLTLSFVNLPMVLTILNGVSSTLMDLNVELNLEPSSITGQLINQNLAPLEEMKQLKQFTLGLDKDFQEFVRTYLLPGCTHIEALNLFAWNDGVASILQEVSDCANAKGSTGGIANFCRLNSISLPHVPVDNRLGVLEALKTFPPHRLKKLYFGSFVDITETRQGDCVEAILQNQASSLEDLEVTLLIRKDAFSLKFPNQMPNLKKLSISAKLGAWVSSFSSVSFGTDSPKINYKKGYPSLSQLQVDPEPHWRWEQFMRFLSLFLPSKEVCTSCTKVEVPVLLNGQYHDYLNELERMFPNATFPPELQAARARAMP